MKYEIKACIYQTTTVKVHYYILLKLKIKSFYWPKAAIIVIFIESNDNVKMCKVFLVVINQQRIIS